ncbi:MAG: four helix bundle protein [Bacteroidota bacterium]|jgi:four helix bundle protein
MKRSYQDLEVYKIAFELFIEVHKFSQALPKFELYELGGQIRRSSDSVVTNIVEGYGRKNYKLEFIRFLYFSHASNLETICHLNKLLKLYPEHGQNLIQLEKKYNLLGIRIYNLIAYVSKSWKPKEH